MSREKRISYLIVTLCTFISGFLLYGGLLLLIPNNQISETLNLSKEIVCLIYGVLGGFLFSSFLSAFILTTNFFSKRKLAFKIVAALLCPITAVCAFYACFFTYIPYQIYNIVKIVTEKKKTAFVEMQYNVVNEEPIVYDIENVETNNQTED